MVDTDDTRRTTNDGRRTTPRVWHKLPTGELKIKQYKANRASRGGVKFNKASNETKKMIITLKSLEE